LKIIFVLGCTIILLQEKEDIIMNNFTKKRFRSSIFILGILCMIVFGMQGNINVFAASANTVIQAHNWSAKNGAVVVETDKSPDGDSIGAISAGDWVRYNGIDFGSGGYTAFMAVVAVDSANAGRTFEIRIDSATGTRIGTLTVANTTGWDTFKEQYATVSNVTGVHDVYLVFPTATPCNINWFVFSTYDGSPETQAQKDARMQWWRDARFGEFIHFGDYSVLGRGEWVMYNERWGKTDIENAAAKNFNPTSFNAQQWVSAIKNAGFKYIKITSKHHAGFAMFDQNIKDFIALSDPGKYYDIVHFAPYGKDVLAALADECNKQGVKFCIYYSIMDWHHPSQTWGYPTANECTIINPGWKKETYIAEMKEQLRILVQRYNPADIWFDGSWGDANWWFTYQDGADLYRYMRTLKPDLIMDDRVRDGKGGDYATPELNIPNLIGNYDVETCLPMNNSWGWNAGDNNWKSSTTLIQFLAKCASNGGNFLLNMGPKPDGTIPQQSLDLMSQIGSWLNTYGESIYGTKHTCFGSPLSFGQCTSKTGKVYLHVFNWSSQITIPKLVNTINNVYLLNNPSSTLSYSVGASTMTITLPGSAPNAADSVVVVDVVGDPGSDADPLTLVSASNNTVSAGLAIDKNAGTRWTTGAAQVPGMWFKLDLSMAKTVKGITLDSSQYPTDYPRGYTVQVSTDDVNYTQVASAAPGSVVQTNGVVTITFAPVSARYIKITQTGSDPGLWWSINELTIDTTGGPTPTPTPTPTSTPTPGGGTNLALGKTVTVSSIADNCPGPNAVDGSGSTRWSSAYSDPQWIYVDLGATYSITQVVLKWEAAYASSYKIQTSTDASNWTDIYSTTTGDGGTDTLNVSGSGRYVRMYGTVRATSYGYSLWEFEIYNSGPTPTPTPTPTGALNRTGWVASGTGSGFSNALDGNAGTTWATQAYQTNGQYFQVDMQSAQTFNKIRLDATGYDNDYPRGYVVYVSSDGSNWGSAIATGSGSSAITDITFNSQTARYIKIVQTGSSSTYWWSIFEFNVYNTGAPTPTPGTTKYEAESGTVGNGATVANDSMASNGQCIQNLHIANAYCQINNINGGSGGSKTLHIIYAANGTATLAVYVNGTLMWSPGCSTTGGWSTFTGDVQQTITLNSGTNNTIKLVGGAGGINPDYITIQ
jgi:alpha-L-fucosidase